MNQTKTRQIVASRQRTILIGNRIPKDFFITTGIGESDITIHAGSFHFALKDAEIDRCNIMVYSSILPAIANEIPKTPLILNSLTHGSVMETIMACANSTIGKRATAGIIFGFLHDKKTNEKYGGLVAEYNGNMEEDEARISLQASLNELYNNGYSENYELKDIHLITKSFIPKKQFGTALVALCFTSYEVPQLTSSQQH